MQHDRHEKRFTLLTADVHCSAFTEALPPALTHSMSDSRDLELSYHHAIRAACTGETNTVGIQGKQQHALIKSHLSMQCSRPPLLERQQWRLRQLPHQQLHMPVHFGCLQPQLPEQLPGLKPANRHMYYDTPLSCLEVGLPGAINHMLYKFWCIHCSKIFFSKAGRC